MKRPIINLILDLEGVPSRVALRQCHYNQRRLPFYYLKALYQTVWIILSLLIPNLTSPLTRPPAVASHASGKRPHCFMSYVSNFKNPSRQNPLRAKGARSWLRRRHSACVFFLAAHPLVFIARLGLFLPFALLTMSG